MDYEQVAQLRSIIARDPEVESVGDLLTMQLGPHQVMLTVVLRFRRGLDIDAVERAIVRMKGAIQQHYQSLRRIYFASEPLQRTLHAAASSERTGQSAGLGRQRSVIALQVQHLRNARNQL